MLDLYSELVSAGVELDSHESDLYAPNVGTVRDIAAKLGVKGEPFICQLTGRPMLDFPFRFTPFWQRRLAK